MSSSWPAAGPPRRVRLHLLLGTLVALAVLPMVGFAIALLYGQWTDGQRRAERELLQSVRSLAVAIERELSASIRQLERIAEIPTLEQDSLSEFHAYATRLADLQREWDHLVLLEADGRPVLNTVRPFGTRLARHDILPVAEVVSRGAAVVSDSYASPVDGTSGVSVLVPVVREGAVRWVLAARLTPGTLSDLLGTVELPAGFVSSVVDRNGLIVARSRDPARFHGRPATPEYLEMVRSAPSGSGRSVTLERQEALAAWYRLDNGWVVGMGSLAAASDAALRRSLWTAAIAGCVMLAAGLAAGGLLSRRIASAVDGAAQDAARLAAQHPVPARHSRIAELDALSDALHRAGARLEQVARERNAATQELNDALGRLRHAVHRRDELLAMLAHELHHCARWTRPGYGATLGEALVSEGLACVFETAFRGGVPPFWARALDAPALDAVATLARPRLDDAAYDHRAWFGGAPEHGIPRHTGYSLGFDIVARHMRATGRTAAQLVHVPARNFYG